MTHFGTITDRLARNSYVLDEDECHIEVNQEIARRTGTGKLLVRVCPAKVYGEAPDGTCLAVAAPGALTWHYPRGGFGIAYREG